MKENTAVTNPSTDLTRKHTLPCHAAYSNCHCGPASNHADSKSSIASKASGGTPSRPFRVAMVPLAFELYDRIAPSLRAKLQQFSAQLNDELHIENVEFVPCEMVSNLLHLKRVCNDLVNQAVDTIVVAHLCYVPSGQILAALTSIDTPIVLWPAQPQERIIAEQFAGPDISCNHSVHGTIDLANRLRRAKRPYGVLHGHWQEPEFRRELLEWCQVGAMLQRLRCVNPLVLGERFPDMLDLRLEEEPFIKALRITPRHIPLSEFLEVRRQVNESAVLEVLGNYQERFDIAPSLSEPLLLHSAKNELVLRDLLEKHQSRALAVNFLDVCREPEIADSLHLPASNLMAEGIGYGAETDWETASMISAMQSVLGNDQVGFTEIFSVDYGGNRVLIRHWGEGNPAQSDGKPRIVRSALNHMSSHTPFPICSFQYQPGRYSLLNLNATPEGKGQLITIPGEVDETRLSSCDGVQAFFRADCTNVRELLNQYANFGGSHHLLLIKGDAIPFAEKLAQQASWDAHIIK